MNIGLYGHSQAQWTGRDSFSYISRLKEHFQAEIVNSGIAMCSEERILFSLKKTKDLDLAIIFHGSPDFIFVPGENRDFCTVDRDVLINKVPSGRAKDWFKLHGFNEVPDEMCEFWEKIPNMPCFEILRDFDITPEWWMEDIRNLSDKNRKIFLEWCSGNDSFIKKVMKEQQELKSEVNHYIELFEALTLNKKYLYHHDLQMNRYYGALIQIDQYLTSKKIPVVHCLGKPWWCPTWFKFSSGVTDSEIFKLRHEETGHYAFSKVSENNLSEEGNRIAFDRILPLVYQAIEKVK
jgi:hypothetical protein